MTLQPGDSIGPYLISESPSEGGMATVYKAWHTGLHRFEALKVPHGENGDSAYIQRLLNEARMAAGLRHPHIVAIHGVAEMGAAVPYIAMEWIEGPDLSKMLQEKGTLSLEEALDILEPVAQALDFAHSRRVVHRDIKPANILLHQEEGKDQFVAKVVDFGISRAAEEDDGATRLTRSGMIVGTPEYMSPEQSGSGDVVDHRTDIYSLGVLAYEILCGRPPFTAGQGVSRLAILVQHVRDEPRSPSLLGALVSVQAEAVLAKALAKSPDARHATCSDFIRELRRAEADAASAPLAGAPSAGDPAPEEADLSNGDNSGAEGNGLSRPKAAWQLPHATLEKTPFDAGGGLLRDGATLAFRPGEGPSASVPSATPALASNAGPLATRLNALAKTQGQTPSPPASPPGVSRPSAETEEPKLAVALRTDDAQATARRIAVPVRRGIWSRTPWTSLAVAATLGVIIGIFLVSCWMSLFGNTRIVTSGPGTNRPPTGVAGVPRIRVRGGSKHPPGAGVTPATSQPEAPLPPLSVQPEAPLPPVGLGNGLPAVAKPFAATPRVAKPAWPAKPAALPRHIAASGPRPSVKAVPPRHVIAVAHSSRPKARFVPRYPTTLVRQRAARPIPRPTPPKVRPRPVHPVRRVPTHSGHDNSVPLPP